MTKVERVPESDSFHLLRRTKKHIVYSYKYSYACPELDNFGLMIWHRPRKWKCTHPDLTLKDFYVPNDWASSLLFSLTGKIPVWRRLNFKLLQIRDYLPEEDRSIVQKKIFWSKIMADVFFFMYIYNSQSGVANMVQFMFYNHNRYKYDIFVKSRIAGFAFGLLSGYVLTLLLSGYLHMRCEVPLIEEYREAAQKNGFVDYAISANQLSIVERTWLDHLSGFDYFRIKEIRAYYDFAIEDL